VSLALTASVTASAAFAKRVSKSLGTAIVTVTTDLAAILGSLIRFITSRFDPPSPDGNVASSPTMLTFDAPDPDAEVLSAARTASFDSPNPKATL
jgi:hypothetical protein